MNLTKYLFPPSDLVCIGPQTSLCTSCNLRFDRIPPNGLQGFHFSLNASFTEGSLLLCSKVPFSYKVFKSFQIFSVA